MRGALIKWLILCCFAHFSDNESFKGLWKLSDRWIDTTTVWMCQMEAVAVLAWMLPWVSPSIWIQNTLGMWRDFKYMFEKTKHYQLLFSQKWFTPSLSFKNLWSDLDWLSRCRFKGWELDEILSLMNELMNLQNASEKQRTTSNMEAPATRSNRKKAV